MKWMIKIRKYDIAYRPKTAMKEQAIADFIAERMPEGTVTKENLESSH